MSKNKQKVILDITVLTAGRVDLFEKCIDLILKQMKPEYRIYVHNNGHPSKEYEEIYKRLPEGSVVKRSNSMGSFSEGANLAIKAGYAPLVFFITDDVFIHEGAIEALLKRMEDASIGQCGYKLVFPDVDGDPSRPAGKVQHIGMASNIKGDMTHPCIGWSSDNPKCNVSREVLAVTGASFMVRREVFNKTRGFDPMYQHGYYEDMDLSMKIRAMGHRVYVDTDAVGTHGVAQTFKDLKAPIPIQQNQTIFKLRWMGAMAWSEWEVW